MEIINTHEAKTHLSRLLERAASGEEFIIARAGKPIARLIGYQSRSSPRTGAHWKGLVRIAPDFDAPLPDEIDRAFRDSA